ncbi:unnamed protein product [Adineta steineri]|uniref:NAD(P)(+)--arginine ADP-ribosyltransferase n=1 Tax=Adineta steineri TaxID=433720 RepID=A0A814N1X1_9BILA|nr:unnamed protein product [Adineta steineri]CAF1144655.1 unnamed protein product [Adineta steineri]
MNKLHVWSTSRNYDRTTNDSEFMIRRRNSRLLIKDTDDLNSLDPIIGYAQEPILPLHDACVPLISIIPDILHYVSIALEHTPDMPSDDLTRDESASIRLYTTEWKGTSESLYSHLNRALRNSNRQCLYPWFKYLKLFLTAIVKLPCIPPQTVWRGVRKYVNVDLKEAQMIWWSFSSTTTSLTVLENELYLGQTGERTLFSIEILNGRSIRAHSQFNDEEEILLLPGTYLEVQSKLDPAPDLHIIHLKQTMPNELLLEPPFEGACLYPELDLSSRRWYFRKRFLVPIITLTIITILTIILCSVLLTKRTTKIPVIPATIHWNATNWATSCDFPGNDLSYVFIPSMFCNAKCLLTQGCTHYTWTTFNTGSCWMKKNNMSRADAILTNDSSMICGIVNGSQQEDSNSTIIMWNGNNWALSCAFNGNDLSNVLISSDYCDLKCTETPGCTHYTWTNLNGGTCWMKTNNVSKNDAYNTNDSSTVCGIINDGQLQMPNSEVQWNGNNWAMSCDFIGNDLSNVQSTSELCSQKCTQTPGCTHFSWNLYNDGTCWLKTNNVTKADAFSNNDLNMICGII